jgi:hypothetical protein
MSLERYLWRVYCTFTNSYEVTISDTEPTVCPVDGEAIDSSLTTILESRFEDIVTDGYVHIESMLADNRAIVIDASDAAGGIDIDAGTGGIAIDTTNALSLDAGAESNFTTSNGNLELQATAGLLNLDGGSGMNIGNDSGTTPILMGTSANAKNITIGNTTSTSTLTLYSGTGGIITYAMGNIDTDTSGTINLATSNSAGGAITLDASSNNGGVTISSGTQGIAINSNGGLIGIGHWSGGNMDFGTAAVARTITMGNTTGATSFTVNSLTYWSK